MVIPDTFEPEKWNPKLKEEEVKPLITVQEKVENLKSSQKEFHEMTQKEKLDFKYASMFAVLEELRDDQKQF